MSLPEPLPYTNYVEEAVGHLYQNVSKVITEPEWYIHAPYIAAINSLKKKLNAIVLAHNYQTPEIFHCIADYTGDSLGLAKHAANTNADLIVQCGVFFMAETSKILCPDKTVLIPDTNAGCSLAESITVQDVHELRELHPGAPVVTYVNTTAEVKSVSDICCTSANAVKIVESLGAEKVIFLPDNYLGRYVADRTDVEIVLWQGTCEVHERFSATDIDILRAENDEISILAHPECPPDVIHASDFVGSTSSMIDFVALRRPKHVALLTECSMSDNVAVEFPDLEFVRPCNLCPHMKKITLPKILRTLQSLTHEISVDNSICVKARAAIERMIAVS